MHEQVRETDCDARMRGLFESVWRDGEVSDTHFLLQEGCGDFKFPTFKISKDVVYNEAKSPFYF